jgi:uncharacterized RmlC-like cupin family protein
VSRPTATSEQHRISTVSPDGLAPAAGYPGIVREVAFATGRSLQARARAEGGTATGWHHHGDREVLGYMARGRARFEFGPGGRDGTDVGEGGFFHVPAGLVHRDVDPTDEPQEFVLVFTGSGPLVVDVDGPEPG